jgi:predicted DNA-binding protein (UPF0251 family)
MTTDAKIEEALAAMHAEGVDRATLGELEARMIMLLYRARRINHAASMLPLIGAEAASERMGCHRSTVYRLSRKALEKVA